jgi:hypothetical protein
MKPQERRPRPDLGCSAIGWMDGWIYIIYEASVSPGFLQQIVPYLKSVHALIAVQSLEEH